jgi:ubiquitin carboxyl-terminal hydrolase 7
VSEGAIEKLFKGAITNFIRCKNVPYKSITNEAFYGNEKEKRKKRKTKSGVCICVVLTFLCVIVTDLSLNVKGCKDVNASFDLYVQTETLSGNNKYYAEGYGLQDAERGCQFKSFPPVLNLQLKRFEYDPEKDAMVKVNDRYAFPPILKLSKYLSMEADSSIDYTYQLHG